MKITSLTLSQPSPKDKENHVFCKCVIVIDFDFLIRGIRVIQKKDGQLFVAMPSRSTPTGGFIDICFPTTSNAMAYLTSRILREVENNFLISERALSYDPSSSHE